MTDEQVIILYSILAATILVFIITIAFYSKNLQFFKRFASKKFKVNVLLKLNPKTLEEHIELNIYNGNFVDERLHGFGIIYKNNNIDYLSTFLEKNNLNNEAKPIVLAHDFVKFEISLEELKQIIVTHNENHLYVKKIKAYSINSQGLISRTNVNALRKVIINRLNKELTNALQQEKLEKKNKKEQKKLERENCTKENENSIGQRIQAIRNKTRKFMKELFLKSKQNYLKLAKKM